MPDPWQKPEQGSDDQDVEELPALAFADLWLAMHYSRLFLGSMRRGGGRVLLVALDWLAFQGDLILNEWTLGAGVGANVEREKKCSMR
jgi:hypothetical protein